MGKMSFQIPIILGLFLFNYASGTEFWLEREYIFEGDDFNMTCSDLVTAPCDIQIYYPDHFPISAVVGCLVHPNYVEYIDAYCLNNDTHKTTSMEVLNGTFRRDDGEFLCSCQTTSSVFVNITVNTSIADTEITPTLATCTTHCGYPADVFWFQDNSEDLDDQSEYEVCDEEDVTKLRIVRSTILLGDIDEDIDVLQCCVGNAGEDDKSSCAEINISYVTTTTTTLTVSTTVGPTVTAPSPSDKDRGVDDWDWEWAVIVIFILLVLCCGGGGIYYYVEHYQKKDIEDIDQNTINNASAVFIKPLTDQKVKEMETATFICEVSKPNLAVKWHRGKDVIEETDKFEMISVGQTHTLIINDAKLDDAVKYTIIVEGIEYNAKLTVEGRQR